MEWHHYLTLRYKIAQPFHSVCHPTKHLLHFFNFIQKSLVNTRLFQQTKNTSKETTAPYRLYIEAMCNTNHCFLQQVILAV